MVDRRLNPLWYDSRYVGLKKLRAAINEVIDLYLRKDKNLVLIDFGCGSMPYKALFDPYIGKYIGADLAENKNALLTIDKYSGRIGVNDRYADVILSTQVLEHVESPEKYLKEAYRVANDNGMLIISTHGFWLYHPDPNDYWRWTASGLRKLLREAGWEVEYQIGVLGFAAASLSLFQDAIAYKLPVILRKPFEIIMQRMIWLTDSFYTPNGRLENAVLYLIVARKNVNENTDNQFSAS